MEEGGKLQRGYFVDGLAGRQFALPGALERLRSERAEALAAQPEDEVVLAAIDPANPWGALLPWPARVEGGGPRPRRVAGAWLVLRGGVPWLFLEPGQRSVITFPGPKDADFAPAVAVTLLGLASSARRRSVRLARIDGEPAHETELGRALIAAGLASPDGNGLRLERG
jgi:ATP-dependent Lhr-like helicase